MNTTTGNIQAWKSLVIGFGKLIACVSLMMLNFANKAAGDGPWDAYSDFSSTQGPVWYYQQRPQPSGSATNMTFTGLVYQTTDGGQTGWLGDYQGIATGHPGNSIDIIRKWVAPSSGTVSITGRVYKVATSGGAGIVASVEKNGTSIWSRIIAYNNSIGYTMDADLGAVSINSGESIAFIVDDNGTYGADQFGWDPVITKITPYDAYAGYTSIQGPVWYYQQRPRTGGAIANMQFPGGGVTVYTTTDYPSGNFGWLGNYTGISTGHPGANLDDTHPIV